MKSCIEHEAAYKLRGGRRLVYCPSCGMEFGPAKTNEEMEALVNAENARNQIDRERERLRFEENYALFRDNKLSLHAASLRAGCAPYEMFEQLWHDKPLRYILILLASRMPRGLRRMIHVYVYERSVVRRSRA